jgi:hypothetical protein
VSAGSSVVQGFAARRARQIVQGLMLDFGGTPEVLDELAHYMPARSPLYVSMIEELRRLAVLGRGARPIMVDA